MARRKFTREFKISAVGLVNQRGYSIPEAARSLGVDPNSLRDWMVFISPPPQAIAQCWKDTVTLPAANQALSFSIGPSAN